jgi:hypothetical protein
MAATPRKALWFNAGVNLPVIALLGEMGNAVAPGSFDTSILRVQQTAMGAIVYSLVAVLVWPERGDAEFLHTMCRIARSQRQVFTGFLMKIVGGQPAEDPDQLLAETARKLPQLRAGVVSQIKA